MGITVEKVSFSYRDAPVLQSVSFAAEYGQLLSVLGPNGAGKSTLFRCMLALLTPSEGSIQINGVNIASMTPRQLSQKIAYIPQSYNPVFNFTVFDMVLMGTAARMGRFSMPGRAQKKLAEQALELLDIAGLKERGYQSISGGQRQLVLIARAIAQQASILLMDEPTASLDFGNRTRVMETVRRLAQSGYAVIQSTHDPEQAYFYSDKILALRQGRLLAWDTPQKTVRSELISALYGVKTQVSSLRDDSVRVCIPADRKRI